MAGVHDGSAALITGGSQGLGYAIARRLRDEGCTRLVIAARDPDKGAAAAERLGATFMQVEMGDPASVTELVDHAAAEMGKVNVLINAAADTNRGSILDTTPEVWDRIMGVNATGPFFAIQRVAQRAIEEGHPASIVNILSMVVHCGQSFLAPYSASKAALANVTRNAANALRHNRIRVNGINIGWMNTPAEDAIQRKWHGAGDDWLEKAAAAQPFGQLIEPGEVAGLAAYMAGPGSGVMTGAVVDYDQNVSGAYPE